MASLVGDFRSPTTSIVLLEFRLGEGQWVLLVGHENAEDFFSSSWDLGRKDGGCSCWDMGILKNFLSSSCMGLGVGRTVDVLGGT